MERERPLDADSEGLLADGEGLAHAAALALDDDALEHLGPGPVALDHLEVHADAIAGGELRPSLQLLVLEGLDDRAHGFGVRFVAMPPGRCLRSATRFARRRPIGGRAAGNSS